jgi:hypothetical protein
MPTLEESYRTLELTPGASDEDVRRAWKELTKVWHPDRFGSDPDLRRRAEQKQKEINEAYETIRAGGSSRDRFRWNSEPGGAAPDGWRVRSGGREVAASGLDEILSWLAAGRLSGGEEVFHVGLGRWVVLREIPEAQAILRRRQALRWRNWGFTLGLLALLLLLRRPTFGGLVLSVAMLAAAFFLIRAWAGVVDGD